MGRLMPDIAARLRHILPPGVVLAQADLTEPVALWPGEALPGAVPARLAEFSAGRRAARQAMLGLGFAPAAIAMGPDRAPIWPAGVTGSISHCAGACLAVMAASRDFLGLGLDLEPLDPVPTELWSTILRLEEQQQIGALPKVQQGLQVLRIFVAKEAAYKAQYAITRQIFDFQDFQIIFNNHAFMAQFCATVMPFEKGFQINGLCAENHRFTAAFCGLPTG